MDELEVPGRPEPPVVEKVTHHSIELSWSPPHHDPAAGRVWYCVQEEEAEKPHGFGNVYTGYSTHHEFTGLNSLAQYRYRLRAINDAGESEWSLVVTVATTRQPHSCENLHRAIQRGDSATAEKILGSNHQFLDAPDLYGSSPLMNACKLGNTVLAEVLLNLGADLEYKNASGKTSLMEACYHGRLKCVKLLLDRGASWTTRDHSGFSALHWAVDGGHVSVVRFALSDGADVDDMDKSTLSGWTPLMRVAAVGGSADVGRILIEHGADVNRRDHDGKTVLMLAALSGNEELVQLLVEHGADPSAKNEYGKTAADFAESFGKTGVAELLHMATQPSTSSDGQDLSYQ